MNYNVEVSVSMIIGIRFPAKDGIFPFVIIRHSEDEGKKLPRNFGNHRLNYITA
jgi:hypothetical protein